MIDLMLPVDGQWDTDTPFVVRLTRDAGAAGADDGVYVARDDGSLVVRCEAGVFAIPPRSGTGDLEGDILAVFPDRQRAWRLIRPGANANTLLLTEECDQRCLMCSQPPKAKRYDHYELYGRAVRLAPAGSVIGISGGEPTLLKGDLLPWLEDMTRARPDVRFHILSNAQHFSEDDLPVLKRLAAFVLWGIPLYGPEAASHDSLVGKEGAFARLVQSLDLCARAGASVELRTVVMRPNLPLLPRLASFVGRHLPWIEFWAIMQLEHIGYARLHWDALFADTSRTFAPLATALRIADASQIPVSLYNFPRCTVPAEFRALAACSISDWKRKYLAACDDCSERHLCGGFFEWQPQENSYEGVRPL